jgi:hypothetical protein
MITETREWELETEEGEVAVYREKLAGIVRESEAPDGGRCGVLWYSRRGR